MFDSDAYEQYYQSLIKLHMRKILGCVFALILFGAAIEAKYYYMEQSREAAQVLFENYLDEPTSEIAKTLQSTHPSMIQTQLVTLLEAKDFFDKHDYPEAEKALTFVVNNTQDEAIKSIGAYRLSILYRQMNQLDKAQSVLSLNTKDSAYARFLEAMTLPEKSTERMHKLNEALTLSPSPYEAQLITIAHHNNIETS